MQRNRKAGTLSSRARTKNRVAKARTAPRRRANTASPQPVALTYRLRTPEDDAYIVQLTEEQLGTVHQQAFQEPFPREQFTRYLQSGAPTYMIERSGKRIGYYSYLIGPDAKMHISAMVVEPTYQSDGVGTQVMKKLEEDARRAGVQVMEVFVQSTNEQSMAFTRKLGFQDVFQVDPNTTCFQKRVQQQGGPQPNGPQAPTPQVIGWFG